MGAFLKSFREVSLKVAIFTFALLISMGGVWADGPTFSYQGRLNVQGGPFTGTAEFGFAILRKDGGETVLWDSDGFPYNDPPSSLISLEVDRGLFTVSIGDTSVPNMAPLDAALFQVDKPLFLRTWVSANGHGLQKLNPDSRIHLTDIIGNDQKGDLVLYVNAATGDDKFSGLNPNHAKASIQGAVAALPAVLRGQTSILIADGTYEGCVTIRSLQLVGPDATFSVIGNEANPSLVTLHPGASSCGSVGISILNVGQTVNIRGLNVTGFSTEGIACQNSNVDIRNCIVANSYIGIAVRTNSEAHLEGNTVTSIAWDGIFASNNVSLVMRGNTVSNTSRNGLLVQASSSLLMDGGSFSNCNSSAIRLAGASFARLRQGSGTNVIISQCGQVNSEASITVEKSSAMTISGVTISGTTGTGVKATLMGMVDFDNTSSSISNMYRGLRAEFGGGILYKPVAMTFSSLSINTEATTNGFIETN